MNKALVKHILVNEFKQKKKFIFFIILPIYFTTAMSFWKLGHESLLFSLSALFTFMSSLGLIITTPSVMGGNNYNRGGQAGSFSWKYIHSIVHDRKSFIIGCIGASIGSLLPLYILLMFGAFVDSKLDIFISLTPMYFLFGIVMCLGRFIAILNFPGRFNYKYGEKTLMPFLVRIRKRVEYITHIGFFFGTFFLFIMFCGEYNHAFAFLAATFSLAIICYVTYTRVINTWADERYCHWDIKREGKKTLEYFLIFILFIFLNTYFHGKIPGFETDVFECIEKNDLVELKKIKISKADLVDTNERGSTPLIKAVSLGRTEIVNYLLTRGASIEDKIKDKDNLNDKFLIGFTPLMVAMWSNDLPMMKLLIQKGANVNAVNKEGMSALSYASAICNLNAMEILVNSGANINQASLDGLTPLFYSGRWKGCLSSILYLTKLGADTSIADKWGLNYLNYQKKHRPEFYNEYIFYMNKLIK